MRKERSLLWLSSFVPLILLLLLPVSGWIWRFAPQLAYLQFPWRWLLVLAPVAALFVAGGLARHARALWLIAAASALCIASLVTCTRAFHQYCDEEDNVSAQLTLMHTGEGQEGTDEYTPRDDDNAEIMQDMPEVRVLMSPTAEEPDSGKVQNPEYQADARVELKASIKVRQWSAEKYDVLIDTPAPGYAVFRLMAYPAWTVRCDGTKLTEEVRRDDGLITVPVPQGRSHIDIRWHTTPDIWLGRAISLLGIGVFAAICYSERRNRAFTLR
jgi:hypothetical protein